MSTLALVLAVWCMRAGDPPPASPASTLGVELEALIVDAAGAPVAATTVALSARDSDNAPLREILRETTDLAGRARLALGEKDLPGEFASLFLSAGSLDDAYAIDPCAIFPLGRPQRRKLVLEAPPRRSVVLDDPAGGRLADHPVELYVAEDRDRKELWVELRTGEDGVLSLPAREPIALRILGDRGWGSFAFGSRSPPGVLTLGSTGRSIAGRVVDPSGAGIPYTLVSADDASGIGTRADAEGRFRATLSTPDGAEPAWRIDSPLWQLAESETDAQGALLRARPSRLLRVTMVWPDGSAYLGGMPPPAEARSGATMVWSHDESAVNERISFGDRWDPEHSLPEAEFGPFEVPAGAADVDFGTKVIPAGAHASFRLLDADRCDLAGRVVTAWREGAESAEDEAWISDGAAILRLTTLRSGQYWLAIEGAGRIAVEIPEGGAPLRELVLAPPGVIDFTIGPGTEALAGCRKISIRSVPPFWQGSFELGAPLSLPVPSGIPLEIHSPHRSPGGIPVPPLAPGERRTVAQESLAPQGSVRGTVVGPGGAPLAEAVIRLGSSVRVTGADGAFEFRWLVPGNLELSAIVPGFLDAEQLRSERRIELRIASDTALELDLSFVPARPETQGRILSLEGLPVLGARVSADDPTGRTVLRATTDAAGQFTYAAIPADCELRIRIHSPFQEILATRRFGPAEPLPAEFRLSSGPVVTARLSGERVDSVELAHPGGGALSSARVENGIARFPLPLLGSPLVEEILEIRGGHARSAPFAIALAAGRDHEIAVELVPLPRTRFRLRVVDGEGWPVVGAKVTLDRFRETGSHHFPPRPSWVTDPDGEAVIEFFGELDAFTVEPPPRLLQELSCVVHDGSSVEIAEGRFETRLLPPAEVFVAVRSAAGTRIEDYSATLTGREPARRARPQGQGRDWPLRLTPVDAGEYTLEVHYQGGLIHTEERFYSGRVDVEVVLSLPVVVHGVVTIGGEPVSGGEMGVSDPEYRSGRSEEAEVDEVGRFRIETDLVGLVHLRYRSTKGEGNSFAFHPPPREALLARGENRVDLEIPGGPLEGTVLAADGSPLAVTVQVNGSARGQTETDAAGRFAWTGAPLGDYTLEFLPSVVPKVRVEHRGSTELSLRQGRERVRLRVAAVHDAAVRDSTGQRIVALRSIAHGAEVLDVAYPAPEADLDPSFVTIELELPAGSSTLTLLTGMDDRQRLGPAALAVVAIDPAAPPVEPIALAPTFPFRIGIERAPSPPLPVAIERLGGGVGDSRGDLDSIAGLTRLRRSSELVRLPAGRYRLSVVDPELGERAAVVEVPAEGFGKRAPHFLLAPVAKDGGS